jgi:SAM-dependent methyltransferase
MSSTKSKQPPYDASFFDFIDDSSLSSARAIVPLVRDIVPCRSVVDVGCGRGAWLRIFQEHGVDRILGLDGSYVDQSSLLIPPESFLQTDLAKPFQLEGSFDLAVCLEVAEHLPRSRSGGLVKELCRAAPAVLFSAAIPGQGGTGHVNEQWPEFWHEVFAANAYEKLDPIRPAVLTDPRVSFWYKQNTYLYVREDLVSRDPRLQKERDLAASQAVQIVSGQRLIPLKSVRGLTGELFSAIRRSLRRRLGF